MRKLQQVVIAAVAAGGLSAVGVGTATAAPATPSDNGPRVSDLFRPYQECSPQTVSENNIPVGVLGVAGTLDTACGQYNSAFNG
ncbi:hypothetical protein [Streptomyces sp. NPDC006012]|uniref:hypothetical protein n=1 Tax=Streptomyces sp. NPDC006012 TaxID=3364739 RepID=UPI003684E42C